MVKTTNTAAIGMIPSGACWGYAETEDPLALTTTHQSQDAWSAPDGILQLNQIYAAFTGPAAGGTADIPGMTITFTPRANRYYRTIVRTNVASSVIGDVLLLEITDETNVVKLLTRWYLPVANAGFAQTVIYIEQFLPGSTPTSATRKARLAHESGAGVITIPSTALTEMIVEDVGSVPGTTGTFP
jgi:hypothetical protein